eukprot:GDKI01043436.1.p1 GENE.GDKI01043436.1~~GDKI01043436.1.p1  ORF type:complete len:493 (-),score=122.74 GDKI01043436.1:192-1634(-)
MAFRSLISRNFSLGGSKFLQPANARFFSAVVSRPDVAPVLLEKIEGLGKAKALQMKRLKAEHWTKTLGQVSVEQCIGGGRSIKSMVTETSELDPERGITFRGLSIPQLQEKLPKAPGGNEPLPEGLLWLLLTGEIPTYPEVQILQGELRKRQDVPKHVFDALNAMPKGTHPMTQLVMGLTALQTESVFADAYAKGMNKKDYWLYALEDALGVIAKIPVVAAYIFRRSFGDGEMVTPSTDPNVDWSANYANMLGYNTPQFHELMRLYLFLHADHEGGNVSAHATHLVGSALSDPYLSVAAGMAGLAGPLHGLANQECLKWIMDVVKDLNGKPPTEEFVQKLAEQTLSSGRVIPGFGHAVLRVTDPRYTAQREFALKHLPDDELFKLVDVCFKTIPPILQKTGKVKNPWPNVDAHSGCLLQHYGFKEAEYFTVLFGVSRAIGVMSQLVWSRILGLPIERPKSVPLDWIEEFCEMSQNARMRT